MIIDDDSSSSNSLKEVRMSSHCVVTVGLLPKASSSSSRFPGTKKLLLLFLLIPSPPLLNSVPLLQTLHVLGHLSFIRFHLQPYSYFSVRRFEHDILSPYLLIMKVPETSTQKGADGEVAAGGAGGAGAGLWKASSSRYIRESSLF